MRTSPDCIRISRERERESEREREREGERERERERECSYHMVNVLCFRLSQMVKAKVF